MRYRLSFASFCNTLFQHLLINYRVYVTTYNNDIKIFWANSSCQRLSTVIAYAVCVSVCTCMWVCVCLLVCVYVCALNRAATCKLKQQPRRQQQQQLNKINQKCHKMFAQSFWRFGFCYQCQPLPLSLLALLPLSSFSLHTQSPPQLVHLPLPPFIHSSIGRNSHRTFAACFVAYLSSFCPFLYTPFIFDSSFLSSYVPSLPHLPLVPFRGFFFSQLVFIFFSLL